MANIFYDSRAKRATSIGFTSGTPTTAAKRAERITVLDTYSLVVDTVQVYLGSAEVTPPFVVTTYVRIFNSDGGSPGAELYASDNAVVLSGATNPTALKTFNFTSITLTPGTYWFVVDSTATGSGFATIGASNSNGLTWSSTEEIYDGSTRRYDKYFEGTWEGPWTNRGYFTGIIIAGTSSVSGAPSKAYNPSPWNGTEEDGCFDFKLTWSDGGGADTYNVYIGGTSGALSLIASEVTNLHYIGDADDFPDDSIVYWRIDSTNDGGTTTGDEWWFDPRVGTATNPTPDDGQGSVSTTQSRLYWDGGKLFQTFDVYIDTVLVLADTTNEYYDLNDWASWPLEYETEYEWYVVSKNVHSEDTGATWSFTTGIDVSGSTDDDRPDGYDPDKVWDIDTRTWKGISEITVSGGGRYKSQIFVLGHNVIYFGGV